jgi:hypothetical protein
MAGGGEAALGAREGSGLMKGERVGAGRLLLAALTAAVVFGIGYAAVRPTNFGGADEWLLVDLASRGVLGVPYANRPLVLLWHVVPAYLWPHDLRAFWAFAGLYLALAGGLTTVLAGRLAPHSHRLALLAGTFAAVWAPLDALRLAGVLSCGYAGFTFTMTAALVLFVESWQRRRPAWLAAGAALGFVAARGIEGVIPVLMVAPLLLTREGAGERRRFLRWTLIWEATALLALGLAVLPLLRGTPSYQGGALGLDLAPLRVLHRLGQLLGMQAGPLVTSAPRELFALSVPAAVLAFLVLAIAAGEGKQGTGDRGRAEARRLLLVGLVLAAAAHGGIALTAAVKTASRTQILSAPGFGLALAGGIGLLASLLPGRLSGWVTLAAGAWVVAVGTGRTTALQGEWDRERGVYARQYRTLEGLVERAPGLAPGTLVILVDESGAWPLSLTFRHAIAYLYPGQAIGLVANGKDFLYPWRYVPQGVQVEPRPTIRSAWRVSPTFHRWSAVVVVRQPPSGPPQLVQTWPTPPLPALPPGARYAPSERIVRGGPRPSSRDILRPPPPGTR